MQTDNSRCIQRTVGRLFCKDGRLHLILDVNTATGFAKVSCRIDDATEVIFMPVSEVINTVPELWVNPPPVMVKFSPTVNVVEGAVTVPLAIANALSASAALPANVHVPPEPSNLML